MSAFHQEFVQALNMGAGSYAAAEAANAGPMQQLLNAINAPTLALFGRPLIGNGLARIRAGIDAGSGVPRHQPGGFERDLGLDQGVRDALASADRHGSHLSFVPIDDVHRVAGSELLRVPVCYGPLSGDGVMKQAQLSDRSLGEPMYLATTAHSRRTGLKCIAHPSTGPERLRELSSRETSLPPPMEAS
jgi:hypothetical protein